MILPDDLHRRFKVHCAIEGKVMSEIVRELIREYLERSEVQTKKTEKL